MHFFRSFIYLFVLGVFTAGCITANGGLMVSQPAKDDPIVIVAFGDSITSASRQSAEAKWPARLQSLLKETYPDREIQVINSGVGGNTSREGLARIEKDVLNHNPDIVLVEFGGNDATKDVKRHVSLDEFRANMVKITTLIQEKNSADVVFLTFPPVIDEWHGWGSDPFFSAFGGADGYVEQYRYATRAIAHEKGLLLIDIDKALRAEMKQSDTKSIILPDGVHLTDDGNRVLAETVAQGLLQSSP